VLRERPGVDGGDAGGCAGDSSLGSGNGRGRHGVLGGYWLRGFLVKRDLWLVIEDGVEGHAHGTQVFGHRTACSVCGARFDGFEDPLVFGV
jgi:hypothetical protein